MSEQAQGTPQPAGQPSGTEQPAGQVQQPPAAQAGTQPATQQANQSATSAAPAQTAQEIDTLRRELDLAKKSAQHFQSNYDRAQQQLRAMTGAAAPPPDPYAARIKAFVDKGYGEEDARMLVDLVRAETEPLRQRNQLMEAQLQGTTLAQAAYQQAADANPGLFADPKIAQATYQALQNAALQGQPDYVTAEYAYQFAAGEYAVQRKPWEAQQPPPTGAPPPRQPFNPGSFGGPPAGYTPMPPTQKPVNPEVERFNEEIRSHFNFRPKQ
jgi:hypothetical protein